MDEFADFYVHACTVETYLGTSGYGKDLFADPIILSPAAGTGVFIEQKRRLVRNKDGVEVISETTLYVRPVLETTPGFGLDLFAPDSRVTIGAAVSRVIVASVFTSGGLDLPDHVAVSLT